MVKLKKGSSNKKIITLIFILVTLVVTVYAVDSKTGIFNLNKKAYWPPACSKLGDYCNNTIFNRCCSNSNLICSNNKCVHPQVSCAPMGALCNKKKCCRGLRCEKIGGTKVCNALCRRLGQTCSISHNDPEMECCSGLRCSLGNKECVVDSPNPTKKPTTAPRPKPTTGPCSQSCVAKIECTENAGTVVSGTCSGGRVCCDF